MQTAWLSGVHEMKYYGYLELFVFSAIAAILYITYPDFAIQVYFSTILIYVVLQLVSAIRFCIAVKNGQVKATRSKPNHYTINEEFRTDWLLMRHVWMYATAY